MTGRSPEGLQGDRSGGIAEIEGPSTANDSTAAARFQPRFTTWRYTLSGVTGVLVMISSEPTCRDEALRALAQHYGCSRILSLTGGANGR